jgi:hypothetical protein
MNNSEHNASLNRKRERIHSEGVPTFNKHDVTMAFNCMGCRKRKEGFRMKVTYTYEKKKNPDRPNRYEWDRKLGTVCSENCYSMVVMRMS